MDESFRRSRIRHGALDAWIAAHRTTKTRKRGFEASARVILARGVRALTRVLFALESRWAPLDHWLEAELKTLKDPMRVAPQLVRSMNDQDPSPLIAALESLDEPLATEGFPLEIEKRRELFLELIHPENRVERATHGLF
jgi:hypothetical protein